MPPNRPDWTAFEPGGHLRWHRRRVLIEPPLARALTQGQRPPFDLEVFRSRQWRDHSETTELVVGVTKSPRLLRAHPRPVDKPDAISVVQAGDAQGREDHRPRGE